MLISMFPGQGAQRLLMGEDLFPRFPALCEQADDVLGYSIRELCLQAPIEKLTQTQFTQPALYVVNCLSYLVFLEEQQLKPDYVLGHSVSEYVALFAAEVLDFASGLRLVNKRAQLMAAAQGGAMAAVLGLSAEQVENIIATQGLTQIYPANFNTPKQIVISGKKEAILAAQPIFEKAGAMLYKILAVSGAFHSPFMQAAQDDFAEFSKSFEFKSPKIAVVSNVTARPHYLNDLRSRMVEQIVAPVKWCESIRYLLAKGAAVDDFVEIGPKGPAILMPMVKRIQLEAGPLEDFILESELSRNNAPKFLQQNIEAKPPSIDEQKQTKFDLSNRTSIRLGSAEFCEVFSLKYPYVLGGMYRGISSASMVIRMARAGMLGFLGAGGMSAREVDENLSKIRKSLRPDETFGVNYISDFNRPEREEVLTDLLLKHSVRIIEASSFIQVSAALVRYRAQGLRRIGANIQVENKILAKVSRPDVASHFLSPAPEKLILQLLEASRISGEQAEMLRQLPMADAISVESDSGGHTDQGNPFNLIPAIALVCREAEKRFPNFGRIFLGAGGGIGTPEAAAAVFMLGADYIVSGSINQCTPEAGTSDAVKDLLASANVYDTAYAPSGAMFEMGAKIQVLRKGLFFPSRAEKLVSLYHQYGDLNKIEPKLASQIQDRYFKCSFDEVLEDIQQHVSQAEWNKVLVNPKYKMAQVIRRYYRDSTKWALSGDIEHKVDFQVHCGPALGALNQWLNGSELEDWRKRSVDQLAMKLLDETREIYSSRLSRVLVKGEYH